MNKLQELLNNMPSEKKQAVMEQLCSAFEGTSVGAKIAITRAMSETVQSVTTCTVVFYRKTDQMGEIIHKVLERTASYLADRLEALELQSEKEVDDILILSLEVGRAFAEDECGKPRYDGTEKGSFPADKSESK